MRQLQKKDVTVLPLVKEECSIPALLTDIKYADCRADRDRGFKELLDAIA